MNKTETLSLKKCYSKAWKSFTKWWIPLCLVAGFLMLFEWAPKQLAKTETQAFNQMLTEVMAAMENNDMAQLEEKLAVLSETLSAYSAKLLTFGLYAAPFVALLSVLLVGIALSAVKNRRQRFTPRQIVGVAFVQLVLAFAKILLLFVFFPLGVFIYIKLYFVSLLMLEGNPSPRAAIKGSWNMASGNFWPLFSMVAINSLLQFFMTLTLIGFIPATAFAGTVRAAAFTILRKENPTPPIVNPK